MTVYETLCLLASLGFVSVLNHHFAVDNKEPPISPLWLPCARVNGHTTIKGIPFIRESGLWQKTVIVRGTYKGGDGEMRTE